MNFGPLNRDGGERRLNVIITRARLRCHVFTNLRADDINLGSTHSIGVRAFKTFLAYAESGNLPSNIPMASEREVDSPFQKAVVSKLRSLDYEAHEEVATGGKLIDIGIVDPDRPGRYILGIECDGATYHSSRSARDRDRIREQVLRGLGWQVASHLEYGLVPQRGARTETRCPRPLSKRRLPSLLTAQPSTRSSGRFSELTMDEGTSEPVIPPYELAQPHIDTHRWRKYHGLDDAPT